jgi:formamidopyrimidine-DNA glycosylase
MPELPEVEVVARSLDSLVKKRRIVAARLLRPRLAPDTTPRKFAAKLSDARINFVHRRGKHILFDLDNNRTLITHLRMSGRFLILSNGNADPKFTHAIFHLDDDSRLIFDDQRHFGLMKIVETAKLHEAKEIAKLAPEPFSEEFSLKYLQGVLKSSKRSIKEFLIDQTKVCGLGNIYASECLFMARVDPEKRTDAISPRQAARLYEGIQEILREAVDLGRTLPIDPQDIGGSIYGNGPEAGWRVYDREGEPCVNCGKSLLRLKQAGRSTYYCRRCQCR